MRKTMMQQILEPDARERRTFCMRTGRPTLLPPDLKFLSYRLRKLPHVHTVSRIAVVRPDKARGVEELLLRMARSGQLQGRVTEAQLVQFLEQISGQEKKAETKITVWTASACFLGTAVGVPLT